MKIVLAMAVLTGAVCAQAATPKAERPVTEKIVGVVGQLRLTVDAGDGYLQAGDMPALIKHRDENYRHGRITLQDGTSIAEYKINAGGNAESVTLGNGLKLLVTPKSGHSYKQTLIGLGGGPIFSKTVDTVPRKGADLVELDPVAAFLGLSARWRQEIILDWVENMIIVRLKGGKALLYIVRYGPDKVGFTPDGKVLFYDVMADIYGGRATHAEEWPYLEAIVPDHFLYTRDGRYGAYVRTPSREGLSAFWTEEDSSGQPTVRFNSGSPPEIQPEPPATATRSSSTTASSGAPKVVTSSTHRNPVPQDFCIVDYTTTYYSDGTSSTQIGNVDCFYFGGGGGGGGVSGGGSSGGGNSYPSNTVGGTVGAKVTQGITNAVAKLANAPCAALLDRFTDASGQTLRSIMVIRGQSDPGTYMSGGHGIVFYPGQSHRDAQGNTPCDAPNYAWTTIGLTTTWVCDRFSTLSTGMAGVIAIHEMLHVLGLPEGGAGQMTSQQITDTVSSACGTT